jgi:hypothetical protein
MIMKFLAYLVILAALVASIFASPMLYVDYSPEFSREMDNLYNQYRTKNGLSPASPLECANNLARNIDWNSYISGKSARVIEDQLDITAKGREECPELPNASFFIVIVQQPSINTEIFNEINSVTPNGVASWSHFGAGRIKYRDGFIWSLVLVDPSGNNGGSSAQSNTDQVSAQGFQGSWDQAASTMYDIWGSHGGI